MKRLLTLILAASLLAACSPSPDTSTTTTVTTRPTLSIPTATKPTLPDTANMVTVVVDGWSVALMNTTHLVVNSRPYKLEPLLTAELESLPPGAVERLAARLLSAGTQWDCEKAVCTDDSGHTHLPEALTVFTDNPLADMYASAGIEYGVWTTRVPVSAFHEDAFLSTSEHVSVVDASSAPEDRVLVVAAGFGVVFPLTPHWLTSSTGYYQFDTASGYVFEDDINPNGVLEAFRNGPSDTSAGDLLRSLSPSTLTFITSPTTGCSTAVNCSVTQPDHTEDLVNEGVLMLCYEDAPLGLASVSVSVDSVTFPHKTHQLGVVTEFDAAPYTRSINEVRALLQTPHVTGDPVTLQRFIVLLWNLHPEAGDPEMGPAVDLVTPLSYALSITESSHRDTASSLTEVAERLLPAYATVCEWDFSVEESGTSEPADDA